MNSKPREEELEEELVDEEEKMEKFITAYNKGDLKICEAVNFLLCKYYKKFGNVIPITAAAFRKR